MRKYFISTPPPVSDNRIYNLRFEDFVYEYEKISEEIIKFCNIDKIQHTNKLKYFNPSQSEKNIGLYLKHQDDEIIEKITAKYNKYLYRRTN